MAKQIVYSETSRHAILRGVTGKKVGTLVHS